LIINPKTGKHIDEELVPLAFADELKSVYGTDFQLLHCTKSRRDPGTADMTDGLSGVNSGAHDPSLP
jgi:hypothetical protein